MDEEKKDVPQEVAVEKTEQEAAQETLNNRVNAFIKAYGELVTEHKIDFATYPMFVPDGAGGFKIVCQNTPVDIGNQPVKSPFIAEAK